MFTPKMVAIAVLLQFAAAPVMAQASSDASQNAHHYQGGPKTEVPHMMQHPTTSKGDKFADDKSATVGSASHRFQGGPKTAVPHNMN